MLYMFNMPLGPPVTTPAYASDKRQRLPKAKIPVDRIDQVSIVVLLVTKVRVVGRAFGQSLLGISMHRDGGAQNQPQKNTCMQAIRCAGPRARHTRLRE